VDVPSAALRAPGDVQLAATLFGETPSRVVVSAPRARATRVLALASELGVPAAVVGSTGGTQLNISVDGRRAIACDVGEAEGLWANAIARFFARRVA
jgi:phosphoribosylformylglycinamidine synthase